MFPCSVQVSGAFNKNPLVDDVVGVRNRAAFVACHPHRYALWGFRLGPDYRQVDRRNNFRLHRDPQMRILHRERAAGQQICAHLSLSL